MTLTVRPRDGVGAKQVRAAGSVPGVIYGPKHPSEGVVIDRILFEKLFKEAGESTIITIEGLAAPVEVLVKEVDFDPARGGVRHVDFYAIERGKEMTTDVPLEFVGTAPVEKLGATVNKVLHEVHVTCRPSALPAHIDVDLSNIASTDDQITVADLVVPAGVTVNNEPSEIVVSVSEARDLAAEDEANAAAPDMTVVAGSAEKSDTSAAS